MKGKKPIKKKKKNAVNLKSNKVELDTTLKKQWIIKAIDLMRAGYSNSYIRDHIRKNKEGSTADTAIDTIISEANAEIVSSQFIKAGEIIPLHIERYNKTIMRLLAVKDGDDILDEDPDYKFEEGEYNRLRERKIRAYNDCINTMFQKEELLQFHSKNFTIEINTEETVQVKEVKPKYELSNLTFEEQVEMYHFLKQAKKDENELLAITEAVKDEATVTEDVEHEVVEKPNVEKIKIEELPAAPYRSPISAADPTIKLRESLEKLAAKRFKEAGGTLTEEEEKLIK